jgi:hypothetical protein
MSIPQIKLKLFKQLLQYMGNQVLHQFLVFTLFNQSTSSNGGIRRIGFFLLDLRYLIGDYYISEQRNWIRYSEEQFICFIKHKASSIVA